MKELSFRILLYRYFFFGWLFLDVNRGNLFERAAAWRHNQAQAHWLMTYMWRWFCGGLLMYALGAGVELLLLAPMWSAFFYVPWALSVPASAVIGVAWIGLKALPEPFSPCGTDLTAQPAALSPTDQVRDLCRIHALKENPH